MSIAEQMKTAAGRLFGGQDWSFYLYGDLWDAADVQDLIKADAFFALCLYYILAKKDVRRNMLERLGDVLEIAHPEEAVQRYILENWNSPEDVLDMFHRVPRASALLSDPDGVLAEVKDFPKIVLTMEGGYALAVVADGEAMSFSLAIAVLRALIHCRTQNFRGIGIPKPFDTHLIWPSFSEMLDHWRKNALPLNRYVPTGDDVFDDRVRPLFNWFRRELGGELLSMTMESGEDSFYRPYEEDEYITALADFRELQAYTPAARRWKGGGKSAPAEGQEALLAIVAELRDLAGKKYRKEMDEALFSYFLYLAASDEYIAGKEATAINAAFGTDYTRGQIEYRIQTEDIYTVTFEERIPDILRTLVLRELAGKGGDAVEKFLHLFERAGEIFLSLDGSMNEDEKRDMKLYLANLRRYVESMKEGDGDEEA